MRASFNRSLITTSPAALNAVNLENRLRDIETDGRTVLLPPHRGLIGSRFVGVSAPVAGAVYSIKC